MNKEQLSTRLFGVFLEELEEHRQNLARDLLAVESASHTDEQLALVESMFRAAHSLKGAARSVRVTSIERICHGLEQHFQDLRAARKPLSKALTTTLFAELDALTAEARKLATPAAEPTPSSEEPKTEAAPAREPVERRALRVRTEKVDELLSKAADLLTQTSSLEDRLADFAGLRSLSASVSAAIADRAGGERELLARLNKALDQTEDGFRRAFGAVLRSAERVDDDAQRLRLVPFAEACEGLDRATRDLAQSVGKPIELSVESHDVELDRAVAQRLRDPLLHLLRNAVTHGIESPRERSERRKPATARVRVAAALRGKSVEVSFSDDGRGFDLQRIRERARALNLDLEPGLAERELLRYALLPGFSTASSVTELSGRGVGLDAVKSAIEAIHGSVEIDSQAGVGVRFVLRLPLTLSKLRCVFASAGGRSYAIPAAQVLSVVRFSPAQVVSVEGRELLPTPHGLLAMASLANVLDLPVAAPTGATHRLALVLQGEGRNVALVVEGLGAEREITARALPARLSGVRQVSSATVLEQGRVALVLNPQDLCRRALERPLSVHSLAAANAPVRHHVLVVEDSATTRAVLKSVLEEAHYQVTTAQDGEQAFTLLQQRPFDLVLSDVQMPHKDGFSLVESVRQHERLSRTPVVLMTSLENEADRLRGLRAGANAYLTKGAFDHQTLLETMAALL